MKVHHKMLVILPGLLALPLLAQPQIGGGTCSTASLNGTYSAVLNGRDLTATATYSNALEGIGSVTFDGLSKATFTFTNNTVKFFGVAQTLSGAYTLQSNCIGTLNITTGDTASFTLETYNNGNSYLITGQDGVYAFSGSGSIRPATCPSAVPAGTYSFNGTGFLLTSAAISGIYDISGVIQVSGANTISMSSYLTTTSGTKIVSSSGTLTVMPNCTATASLTDTTGTAYMLVLEITSANGESFSFSSSSAGGIFSGNGRVL